MSRKDLVIPWLAVGVVALVASCSESETKAAPKGAAHAPTSAPAVAPDRTLEEHVQKAILADSSLSPQARSVTVSVQDGTVTLRGTVADAVEKSNMTALASNIPGVRRVENLLEVGNG